MKEIALYIHIPFCVRKCKYCDFVSFATEDAEKEEYINALIKEISLYKEKDYLVKTVFFGGGTPSILSHEEFEKIINAIFINFKTDITEFTVEANPESLTEKKLQLYKSLGVNRISIGIQSLSERLLKVIGRVHGRKQALKALELSLKFFDNVNVDLMTGLPYEDDNEGLDTLSELMSFNLKHISLYSLILEEHTPLNVDINRGLYKLPTEDDAVDRFNKMVEYIEKSGFNRYEVSNFAKEGYYCRHNMTYWTMGEYMGLGLSAHGYIDRTRLENHIDMNKYLSSVNLRKLPYKKVTKISDKETEFEYIMLGLRLIEGIDLNDYERRFKKKFKEFYYKEIYAVKSYLDIDDNRIAVNEKYFNLLNSVILNFLN